MLRVGLGSCKDVLLNPTRIQVLVHQLCGGVRGRGTSNKGDQAQQGTVRCAIGIEGSVRVEQSIEVGDSTRCALLYCVELGVDLSHDRVNAFL